MLAYAMVGSNDLERAGKFYDAVLAPLGIVRSATLANEIGYAPARPVGEGRQRRFFVCTPYDKQRATVGNGVDIAFEAPSRAAIDAFHATALAHGGTCEGPPGLRPHYSPTFYTAYVRDPDGNKINAVYEK
jgi:catechol 2,3-dioxygenase-like lactoylglutathione lyase family enzyme